MEKNTEVVSLQEWAEYSGRSWNYLRQKIARMQNEGKDVKLDGVESMKKIGHSWALTIEKRKKKKPKPKPNMRNKVSVSKS